MQDGLFATYVNIFRRYPDYDLEVHRELVPMRSR